MYHKQKHLVRTITYIAMCVALISICAWITIPFPINFTLQIFAVFFVAAISDWKKSFLSVLAYIGLGLCGAPVFSGFQAGPSVFLGVTGGYLIGFLASALVIGIIKKIFANRRSILLIAMILALLLCYLFGVIWYMLIFMSGQSSPSIWQAICVCFLPFLLPDLMKIFLAYFLANRVEPFLRKIDF